MHVLAASVPLTIGLVGPQARSGRLREQKNLFHLPGIKPSSLDVQLYSFTPVSQTNLVFSGTDLRYYFFGHLVPNSPNTKIFNFLDVFFLWAAIAQSV